MGSGLILDDEGKKMSKSSANGVSPTSVIDEYGADVARLIKQFSVNLYPLICIKIKVIRQDKWTDIW